jgi:lysozyme
LDRQKLKAQLELHEGKKPKVYLDSQGIPTIGIGRNLRDKGLTEVEIEFLLDNDIDECESDLKTFDWWDDLDDVRQRVLLDMRFNLGPSKFRGFKRTLKAVQDGKYTDAAKFMLDSKWAKQVKGRARRLALMMEHGRD